METKIQIVLICNGIRTSGIIDMTDKQSAEASMRKIPRKIIKIAFIYFMFGCSDELYKKVLDWKLHDFVKSL